MAKKIDRMHEMFGRGSGRCGDCCHFVTLDYHNVTLQKCEVYGLTHSEASDWVKKWESCGLYNKPWNGDVPVIELTGKRVREEQCDGQLRLEL